MLIAAGALIGCLGGTSSSGGGSGNSPAGTPSPSMPAPGSPLPPAVPPAPGGFQQAIAPLLDAQGCTECHHAGRPIDLTRYPFMAGDPATAAQQLITSLSNDMPPAPRDRAPTSVTDAIAQWKADGMKP
jgi:hypothetical protein